VYFVRNVAAPLIHEFQPDMVLVASGFSAAKGESEGFGVTPVGFAHMTKIISSAARCAGGPLVTANSEG
jgi:histone deacetylase 6